jgi:hypothetical protein
MVRKKLRKRYNQRIKCRAFVDRFGARADRFGYTRTILLVNVYDNRGERLTDHVWFDFNKTFEKAGVKAGDLIQFYARVKLYRKGYKHEIVDYKLSYPSKVLVLRNNCTSENPYNLNSKNGDE